MENSNKKSKVGGFFSLIKNLFMILIFLQFAPMVFSNIKNAIKNAISPKAYVGVISVKGMISSSSNYLKHIEYFLKNDEIKGLLLKIDSPGGFPGTSQLVFSELKKFKTKKPVVALVENMCTSAAYYIAIGSNTIISQPSSLVGGIGVFMQIPEVEDLLKSWKIKFHFIQSGTYKTAGSPLKKQSVEELEYLQKLSDNNYEQFISDVSKTRGLDINQHQTWADGKVFLGNEGKKLKLIDKIGSFQDALDEIRKIAKIDKKQEIKLIAPKKSSLLMKMLGGEEDSSTPEITGLTSKVANFLHNVYTKFMEKHTETKINNIRMS